MSILESLRAGELQFQIDTAGLVFVTFRHPGTGAVWKWGFTREKWAKIAAFTA